MLDHLIDFEPDFATPDEVTPIEKASVSDIVAAQHETAKWLESVGAPVEQSQLDAPLAQQAFSKLTNNAPVSTQTTSLLTLKTPAAVQHLVGMLTAYDWEFVQQARELRGYAVSQILEETKHPDAKIRLKALEMLGKVTEVALFTDRVEVKKADMQDAELNARIQEKLNKFMGVVDANPTDIEAQKDEPNDEAA